MEKIKFTPDGEEAIEFFVLEQTTISGVDYYLVTEEEEGDGEAFIMKDLSTKDSEEAVFEFVEDDAELDAVGKIFESILDEISFQKAEDE